MSWPVRAVSASTQVCRRKFSSRSDRDRRSATCSGHSPIKCLGHSKNVEEEHKLRGGIAVVGYKVRARAIVVALVCAVTVGGSQPAPRRCQWCLRRPTSKIRS